MEICDFMDGTPEEVAQDSFMSWMEHHRTPEDGTWGQTHWGFSLCATSRWCIDPHCLPARREPENASHKLGWHQRADPNLQFVSKCGGSGCKTGWEVRLSALLRSCHSHTQAAVFAGWKVNVCADRLRKRIQTVRTRWIQTDYIRTS